MGIQPQGSPGQSQKSHPDTNKRQKPIHPCSSFKKLKGLMNLDFLRPNDFEKLREPLPSVNGFRNYFAFFWTWVRGRSTATLTNSPTIQ
jgi:hypothetical protein